MKSVLAGVGNIFVESSYRNRVRLRVWVIVALWVVAIAAVVCGIVFGIASAVRSAGAASCRNFAQHSGYSSAYHIQHWMDGGTCFVTLPNGHALPQKMVVAYLKANK